MAGACPVWAVVVVASTVLAGLSAGFQWKSREFLYVTGCAGSNVTFPWHYEADIGETIDTIYWTRWPGQSIASRFSQKFTPKYEARIGPSALHAAALQVTGLQVADTGYYTVDVTVHGPPGPSPGPHRELLPKHTYNASALLIVSEAPVIAGDSLEVTEVTSPDPCSQRQQRTLSCGSFLSRGFPPVDVVFTDPVGQLLRSTRFGNNRFDLDLPLRPLLGNYSCRLHCQASVRGCLPPGTSLHALYLLRPLADDGCPAGEREGASGLLPAPPGEELEEKTGVESPELLGLWQNVTDVQETIQGLLEKLSQAESREKEREAEVRTLKTQLDELRALIMAERQPRPTTTPTLTALTPGLVDVEKERMNQMRDDLNSLVDAMQQVKHQMAGSDDELRSLRKDLNHTQQQMAGQEDQLETLRLDLDQTQQQMAGLDNELQTLRLDLNQTQDRHVKGQDDLLTRVEAMEERQRTVTPEATPALTTPLQWALTTPSDSLVELSDLSSALTRLSERVDKQCSNVSVHPAADLTLLETRLDGLDRKVRALHPGTPMPSDVDPLVSTLRPSLALRAPGTSGAVVQDFTVTHDGKVLLALDRIVMARNVSSAEFISRPLKHGNFLRCVTALGDGTVAATVDERYVLVLQPAALDTEDFWEGEQWLATDSPYYGIAARSPQTLYASVIDVDSADQTARIDVITINEDRSVVIATLLTSDVTKELTSPRSLTLHEDALYASDWESNVIVRYDLNSREASVIKGPPSTPQLTFFQPRHTAFDVTGNMYVSTGGNVCGGRDLYSEGFCVLVISREGAWRRLLRLGPHVYPYGITVTPTGLVVSWASYVSSTPQSLLQWYDYVLPAHAGGGGDPAALQGRPAP